MALVRPTAESAERYAASLENAVEHADAVVLVLDETARIAVTAIGLGAARQKVAYDDAMEDVFRHIDDADEGAT